MEVGYLSAVGVSLGLQTQPAQELHQLPECSQGGDHDEAVT